MRDKLPDLGDLIPTLNHALHLDGTVDHLPSLLIQLHVHVIIPYLDPKSFPFLV